MPNIVDTRHTVMPRRTLFSINSQHPSITKIQENDITHSILDFKPIEESFISKQINKLSLKKATGHDGISAKILKFAKPVVLQPITNINKHPQSTVL